MTGLALVLLVAAVVAVIFLVGATLAAYRDALAWLQAEDARPPTPPIAAAERSSQGPQGRPPEGVDGSRSGSYDVPPRVQFSPRDHHLSALAAVPLGTALQPDFDAFFGGLGAAVQAGGVLLIAVVVVMTIRRFVSF